MYTFTAGAHIYSGYRKVCQRENCFSQQDWTFPTLTWTRKEVCGLSLISVG